MSRGDLEDTHSIHLGAAQISPFSDAWDIPDDFEDAPATVVAGRSFDEMEAERSSKLPVNTLVAGRYVVQGILGEGGMGTVYAAEHISTGQEVALKYVEPSKVAVENAAKRFFRESQISALVQHPNVVEVFDGGKMGKALFLVMERLRGETLGDVIERRGALPPSVVLDAFLGITAGVAAVHAHGVIHRDLKPDNVFLTPGDGLGHPKVLDFGISKLKHPETEPAREAKLTTAGVMMGTPHYMSPEQFLDASSATAHADVYSLGAMLYEALAGQTPYEASSVLEMYGKSMQGDRAPLRDLQPAVSAKLAAVVSKALEADPANRFESVQAMHDALQEAKDARSRTVPDMPTESREPRVGAATIEDAVAPRFEAAQPAPAPVPQPTSDPAPQLQPSPRPAIPPNVAMAAPDPAARRGRLLIALGVVFMLLGLGAIATVLVMIR